MSLKVPGFFIFIVLVKAFSPVRSEASIDITDSVPVSRVIGGRVADSGVYPFYAVSASRRRTCGGVLIHTDVIATAAHCGNAWADGAYIGGNARDADGKEYAHEGTEIRHPDYVGMSNFYMDDIMLVKVTPLEVNTIEPVTINFDSDPEIGDRVTTMGHGVTNTMSWRTSNPLLETTIDIMQCPYWFPVEQGKGLCAGLEAGGSSACYGDTGGPLLNENKELVGLVSWGFGCGLRGRPGVYVKIRYYEDFIKNGICQLTDFPTQSCLEFGSLISHESNIPTDAPTLSPSAIDYIDLSGRPTVDLTIGSTGSPAIESTNEPSKTSTPEPTTESTTESTIAPTGSPTSGSTSGPTASPTGGSTSGPTASPTGGSTSGRTASPTVGSTSGRTASPTVGSTSGPTASPTVGSTSGPTASPTVGSTNGPTASPTAGSTSGPTASPTSGQTVAPTESIESVTFDMTPPDETPVEETVDLENVCQDTPGFKFTPLKKEKTCAWLTLKEKYRNNYCYPEQEEGVYENCRKSCGLCTESNEVSVGELSAIGPTLAPVAVVTAPDPDACEDDLEFRFTPLKKEKNCAWLTQKEKYRNNYCYPEQKDGVYDRCRRSCGLCTS